MFWLEGKPYLKSQNWRIKSRPINTPNIKGPKNSANRNAARSSKNQNLYLNAFCRFLRPVSFSVSKDWDAGEKNFTKKWTIRILSSIWSNMYLHRNFYTTVYVMCIMSCVCYKNKQEVKSWICSVQKISRTSTFYTGVLCHACYKLWCAEPRGRGGVCEVVTPPTEWQNIYFTCQNKIKILFNIFLNFGLARHSL